MSLTIDQINALQAENERLRSALNRAFAYHYQGREDTYISVGRQMKAALAEQGGAGG